MREYLNNLKVKFNYSEELMEVLAKIIPALITYYGKDREQLILEAIYNCEIHIQEEGENMQEYLNNYYGVYKERKIVDMGGAMYHNELFIKNNVVNAKPIIYLLTNFWSSYYPFDFKDEAKLDTLIHEICHLIKGYGKVKVSDGKVYDRDGLIKDTYIYSLDDTLELESSIHVGIEEALNARDTMKVVEIVTGIKAQMRGYPQAGTLADYLLVHEDIAKVIKDSQFNGDDKWIEYLGEDNAKMLIDNFDVLVNTLYLPFRNDTIEQIIELHQTLNAASDEILDFIKNYNSNIDKEIFNGVPRTSDKKMAEFLEQIKLIDEELKALDAIDNDAKMKM